MKVQNVNAALRASAVFFSSIATTAPMTAHSQDADTVLAPVRVIAEEAGLDDVYRIGPAEAGAATPDSAELLRRVPGANVNRNGPLSGVPQYRGLYGTRMNVVVDGIQVTPGGPNWMDPPLHYAPAAQLDSLELVRGISPVSISGESLGGHISANLKTGEFASGEAFEFHGSVRAGGQSVDEGYAAGSLLTVSNRRHKAYLGASREEGDDYEFAGGEVTPTKYERDFYTLGYGFDWNDRELGVEFRRNETGDTGTPALPMDIDYFNTSMVAGTFEGALGAVESKASLFYTDVGHRMTNYHLRKPANPAMRRFSVADSKGSGYTLSNRLPVDGGTWLFGVDGHLTHHDADIGSPDNAAFFVNNFSNVDRNRHGGFLEWRAPFARDWNTELGVRYNRVYANAGKVDATPARVMPGPGILRDRFNAADRSRTDNNFDWVAKLFYDLAPGARLEVAGARKTRSPSYQELYLWLPLEATAGLADGKRYVGNIDLDAEVSHHLELGLDWRSTRFYFAPRAYYRRVKDYIQGTPATDPVVVAVSAASGDPDPLQFNNVDAELYGFDAEFGVALDSQWSLDGVASYVRGKRRDVGDDLYRIAPPNAILGLSYRQNRWSATVEGEGYADQNHVSETNEEKQSDGFVLLNVRGTYRLGRDLNIRAGIANLLDKHYENHLGGYNRVVDSDVDVGERIPGPGRSFFASASLSW